VILFSYTNLSLCFHWTYFKNIYIYKEIRVLNAIFWLCSDCCGNVGKYVLGRKRKREGGRGRDIRIFNPEYYIALVQLSP
jgi:hypothetical protein